MTEPEKAQAEELEKQEDVKQALEQAMPPPEARIPEQAEKKTRTVALGIYAVAEPERVQFPRSNIR